MEHLVRNERLKLLANAFDRVSTACLTFGGIALLATLIFTQGTLGLPPDRFALASLCWILLGIGLHLLAQEALKALR